MDTWLEAAVKQFITITESPKATRIQCRCAYDVMKAAVNGERLDLNACVEARTMKTEGGE